VGPDARCRAAARRRRGHPGARPAVADLLAHVPGVTAASVEPHCEGRFLLAILSVEAHDLAGAIDRAAAFLRSSAADAGVGPLVLVGARCSGRE
jgi:hypothetical protein